MDVCYPLIEWRRASCQLLDKHQRGNSESYIVQVSLLRTTLPQHVREKSV
jgi:hypothetical protein